MQEYFDNLEGMLDEAYEVARKARSEGYDPEEEPEIPLAEDLAERVETLAGPEGVAEAIRRLEEDYSREDLAFKIAEMIVDDEFGHMSDGEAAEQSIRTTLAIITEGIAAAAPIEGITKVDIKKNFDGSPYLAIYFAGPIRSAGGTAAALAVLTGDFIRRKLNLNSYDPSDREVERAVEEVSIYDASFGLQYSPSEDEVRRAYRNIPIEISGEPTEQETVTVNRDLERVETNRVRGGAVLTIAEGVLSKAPKILKHLENLDLSGWEWLRDLRESASEDESGGEYPRGDKYLNDIIAGRGVFGHPARPGGFRLRYGRARNTGLAAAGIHPATMRILDDHVSAGTQLKTERPGKATAAAPVDTLEGPTVKLNNGSVVYVDSSSKAREIRDRIDEIISVGDILFGYGEFLENNHPLMPSAYCEEWWAQEVKKAIEDRKNFEEDLSQYLEPPYRRPSPRFAVELSRRLKVPLHPAFTYPYHDLDLGDIGKLGEWLASGDPNFRDGVLTELRLDLDEGSKRILEVLGVPHDVDGEVVIVGEEAFPLCECLDLLDDDSLNSGSLETVIRENRDKEVTKVVNILADFPIRKKAPTRIGTRMGRPEKTKPRRMKPPPHVLFPIGWAGGSTRNINKASDRDVVEVEVAFCKCPECGEVTMLSKCPKCGARTEIVRYCPNCDRPTENEECMACGTRTVLYKEREVELKSLLNDALGNLQETLPDTLKGVVGMTSAYKLPEPLEKGILRAKHDISVFKDGTIRFDATDLPLTHFTPREVKVSVEGLKELGYETDYKGDPLEIEDQVLELKVQDILLPKPAAEYLLRVAQYVDELLQKFYDQPPFYNASNREDLLGHLVIGLAPHTSAGITGRIIGFTDARAGYAHPYFHAAKRRNCMPGNSEVYIENSGNLKKSSLKELFEEGASGEVVDDFGTEARTLKGKRALGFDLFDGSQKEKEISKVFRTPAPGHKFEITTRSGRKMEVFPDHRVPTSGGIKKARELEEGDEIFTPERVDISEKDIKRLDLLEVFLENDVRDVVVREIESFLRLMVREVGGLKRTAQRLGINKKTFSNYVYRNSIPLQALNDLLELTGRDLGDVPPCKIAAKRDSVELERWIEVDKNFMKMVGYYLAEGYSRKSEKKGEEFYQTCFAWGDEELKEEIISAIRSSLNVDPYQGDRILTVSSRLVRELFVEVLGLGEGAHSKSIPLFFKGLPKQKVANLLAAYFAGDGSVERGRLHVSVHSVSRDLLRDVAFLLNRFGVFSRFKTETRKAGGILLEKYGKDKYADRTFTVFSLSIRSSYAVRFGREIGFAISSKQSDLEDSYPRERKPRIERIGDLIKDPIESLEMLENGEPYMYDVKVEDIHNFLTEECVLSNNCDGDEDAVMLLLDALLNFSQYYLPESRGGKMDAPLVLTPRLDPSEIDDEAQNLDVDSSYSLEFYEATLNFEDPGSFSGKVEVVEDRLGTEGQYEDIGFSEAHNPTSISAGPSECRYKSLGPMDEKTESQLSLARRLRSVDESDVVERLIENHFIPDLRGNLRAFSRQKFRCASCNTKYRRIPLTGECENCGSDLILTVTRGGVEKYMEVAMRVAEEYGATDYTKQRLKLVEEEIFSLFESDIKEQLSLADFA